MRSCELCQVPARMYCDSDQASLCWDCDLKVHGANFLVARHSRTLLCQACQSPTPWSAAGAKLSPTVSICRKCSGGDAGDLPWDERDSYEISGGDVLDLDDEDLDDDVSNESDAEEEDMAQEDEDEDDDEGENQVVPWSSSLPAASSPSSERYSDSASSRSPFPRKRSRDNSPDLQFQETTRSSRINGRESDEGLTTSSREDQHSEDSIERALKLKERKMGESIKERMETIERGIGSGDNVAAGIASLWELTREAQAR